VLDIEQQPGTGDPVLLIHGLGATKASFLPTLGALARTTRPIALDLPGFGDSTKPLLASYDAPFFADAVAAPNQQGAGYVIDVTFKSKEKSQSFSEQARMLPWCT